jgi:hypothetical protein
MNRDEERDVVAPFSFPTKATDQQYQTQVLLLSYKNDQVMENDGQVSQQIQDKTLTTSKQLSDA